MKCNVISYYNKEMVEIVVWVFMAQLVEHCSTNAEATSLNPVEARSCLNCDSTAMVTFISFEIIVLHVPTFSSYSGFARDVIKF